HLSPPCLSIELNRVMEAISQENEEEENDVVEVRYKLTLIGSLSVHYLTTMAMLPWVVAEISKAQDSEKKPAEHGPSPQIVFLCVSVSWVRCVSILGEELLWDPLTHRLLFECLPHQVTKLIHNSQEPSSFGCLVRDSANCACYVFRCQDSSKVPEIISVLRKAGKSSARNDNVSKLPSGVDSDLLFSTNFAKRFEVLFCGRVTVPHKNAPPALIDECIVKFSQLQNSVVSLREGDTLGLRDGLKTLVVPANGLKSIDVHDGSTGSPTTGKHPVLFKRAPSFPCLQALDENGLSPEICQAITTESHLHLTGVQPTSQQQNSNMLFMVTESQILLVSPETKKTSMEKSFREISFCSQGIHHVDHFGFICRETAEEGNCHFVCYVFQCASESLVDEIMLTLKQAFSRAVEWKKSNPQWQQCDACPLMQFHRLCERIEGGKLFLHCVMPHLRKLKSVHIQHAIFISQPYLKLGEIAITFKHLCFAFQRSCPKSDKEENELVMASLRRLYEKKQSNHQHSVTQNSEEVTFTYKLGQLKSRAKRSLTESLEGIWKVGNVQEKKLNRSKDELRELWRTAIKQQILLQRMEKENLKLKASENNLQNKRLKLDYDEITPCLKEVTLVWEKMLATPDRPKVKVDMEIIHAALAQGVPKQHRGEVWKFLSEQHLLRQTVSSQPPPDNTAYKELLKQVSSEQHAILIDLGRTFPTHPYFEESMGPGQLSLYNVLSAYSVLDPEVGYCQGLCFVTGVLLLHLEEEDAFNMLKFLMFVLGLRQQYKPSMTAVQIQMYQLSRLLHDYHKDLQCHLEQQDIAPSLYAPPWFLTNFASQYPLGFVARVFDMLFLQGPEVIFKVGLSLLGSHKLLIMQHDSLESIVDVIKTELPNLGLVQMEKTVNQVCEMDLTKQLQAYEVEYQVLNDELHAPSDQRSAHLEKVYQSLQQQNSELMEELQVSHVRVSSLEQQLESLVQSERLLKEQVSTLELEKNQLVDTVARLQQILAKLNIQTSSDGHTLPSTSERHKLTKGGMMEREHRLKLLRSF
uniref:TBC1 domain family member 4 n=1 Tax=Takifugu rubripes TaxID=31033 RepID=A0A674MK22_TAKRU